MYLADFFLLAETEGVCIFLTLLKHMGYWIFAFFFLSFDGNKGSEQIQAATKDSRL